MRRALEVFGVLVALLSFSTVCNAGVRNSKHDLTLRSFSLGNPALLEGTHPCVYCHAPHAATEPDNKPLWNRADPVTQIFTLYGTTIIGTVPDTPPNTASLRCLGCHDGVTAVDPYSGGACTPAKIRGNPCNIGIGGNLSSHHAVSIGTECITGSLPLARSAGLVFYECGTSCKVECPTCHNPHLTSNTKFLRVGNNGGGLCLTCHNK
jgi:predicted CXXCH cytochrome family protein